MSQLVETLMLAGLWLALCSLFAWMTSTLWLELAVPLGAPYMSFGSALVIAMILWVFLAEGNL